MNGDLTVTGTSAEAGDDGEAGRGNRANGLITPGRPMTLESVAGKNPVSHVGKLYNLAAFLLVEQLADAFPDVAAFECLLVSRIGGPVTEPQLAEVRVACEPERLDDLAPRVREITADVLAGIGRLAEELVSGRVGLDRWPLRR